MPSHASVAGFDGIEVGLTQPLALRGDVKLVHALTLENIRDAVVDASLATPSEVDALIHALHAMAADDETLMATPRIVQTWARRS